METPLTVALTTYNRSSYLKQSLSAIVEQTYSDFEILVLDNGSTDDTPDVVLGFKDTRLRYIRNAPGYTSIFNSLSAQWISLGRRLLITHDDDIMEREMLQQQMDMINAHPELTAIWTNKSIIDGEGNTIQQWFSPPGENRRFERGEFIARAADENLWHPPSSLIFIPQLLMKMQALRLAYRTSPARFTPPRSLGSGDIIRPAMMNLAGPVLFLNAPLLRYRQHSDQETQRVHVAQAALHSYRSLRTLVRRTEFRHEYEPIYDAQICRFQAQDLVIATEKPTIGKRKIARLTRMLEHASRGIQANQKAGHMLLPLMIMLLQLGVREPVESIMVLMEEPDAATPRSIRSLYLWASLRREDVNIFETTEKHQSIAIFGSVFISALLIQEARDAGIDIKYCIDSNATRHEHDFLGLPIISLSSLVSDKDRPNLIVLSSERDHEDELVKIIHSHHETATVASWKDLVEVAKQKTAHDPEGTLHQ